MVYLITGKQGSGKTHYAEALASELEREGATVKHIDGDVWRSFHQNQDYSDEGRITNLMSAAELAMKCEQQGMVVVMSFIAPKKEWRDRMRSHLKESKVIYIPGGSLWPGTTYEKPTDEELNGSDLTRVMV
jgi:adenylylsulfate kinase-like enzyme